MVRVVGCLLLLKMIILIVMMVGLAETFAPDLSGGEGRNTPAEANAAEYDDEVDLLQAITIPFDDPKHLYYAEGSDGFLAFGVRAGSNIKTPFGLLYSEEKLFRDFVISAKVKPADDQGGYLFAILSPMDRLIQLGVKIDATKAHSQNISLFYSEANHDNEVDKAPKALATFAVPALQKVWNTLVIVVEGNSVTLALPCQDFEERKDVVRKPKKLSMDMGATLYIGQAGAIFSGAFEGVLQELKLSNNLKDHLDSDEQCSKPKDFVEEQERKPTDGGGGEDYAYAFEHDKSDGTKMANLNNLRVGPKGDRGPMGPRGPPGKSLKGPPGPPGLPGAPGPIVSLGGTQTGQIFGGLRMGKEGQQDGTTTRNASNFCGCNEEVFLSLANQIREIMPQGTQGTRGLDGAEGPQGPPGLRGTPGLRGPKGDFGDKGARGDRGMQGPEGLHGQKGQPGKDGFKGEAGQPGPPGLMGTPGMASSYDPTWKPRGGMFMNSPSGQQDALQTPVLPGPKGDRGVQGPQGDKGHKGESGNKGERGDPGLLGPQGDRGYEGPAGPPGYKGEEGAPGHDGIPGSPGRPGLPGKGEKGDRGNAGAPGPPGFIKRLSDRGVEAEVLVAPGAQGPSGVKGQKGDSGSGGMQGPMGEPGIPGKPGLKGPAGPPADLTKLDEATLNALRGKRGKRGKRGPVGPPGPPGPSGPPGASGVGPDSGSKKKEEIVAGDPFSELRKMNEKFAKCDDSQTLKVANIDVLYLEWQFCPPGTLAFLQDEESVLVKIEAGWRYLALGNVISQPGTSPLSEHTYRQQS